MQLSTITRVFVGFAFGAVIGGSVISAISNLNYSTDQLSTELAHSTIVSQTNSPPMPPCPPPPEPQTNCMTPEQLQMWQQAQQQQQTQQQPPPNNQYPDPNQTQNQTQNPNPNYQPPSGQSGQYPPPEGNQQPPSGQNPNPNQYPSGQPGQYGQPGQPFNAASIYQGPPPGSSASNLTFQQPAGLQDPDKCFREKGGQALVDAVRTGRMTPALMSSAASCFSANFNGAPGQGQSGQGGPGGAPGQSGQPFGQMSIFSGKFIETMSGVKPPSNDCVVKIAGEAVAEKMFGQGIQPDNETRDKIFKAGCFGPPPGSSGQSGPNGQPGAPGRQFAGPPLEVVDCLNKISGNGDIQSGKRNPTPAEYTAGQSCYAKAGAIPFFVPPGQVSENSPLSLCAKAVIGVTDISTITPTSLTREQKQRMRQCYAPSGEQAMANTQPSLPQEAADCIKKIMGETAFAQLSTGRVEPTAEQRKAGATCFQKATSKIGELSDRAVPWPQARALMAEVDSNLVPEPTVIPPTTAEVSEDPDASMFKLTGEVADGETVDVYYNSDSTIITADTKDGDNGKKTWSTEVAYSSLSQDEEHTLYAVMTKSDGSVVRSPLVAFAAKAADSTETTSDSGTNRNMLILYGALGLLAIALVGYFVIRQKHRVTA